MCGKETADVSTAAAGDIVVVPKLEAADRRRFPLPARLRLPHSGSPNSLYRAAIEPDERHRAKLFAFLEGHDADQPLRLAGGGDTGRPLFLQSARHKQPFFSSVLSSEAGVSAHKVALRIPLITSVELQSAQE